MHKMNIKIHERLVQESGDASFVYTIDSVSGYNIEDGVKRSVFGGHANFPYNKQFSSPEELIDYAVKRLHIGKRDNLTITLDDNSYYLFITFDFGAGSTKFRDIFRVSAIETRTATPSEYRGKFETAISNRG